MKLPIFRQTSPGFFALVLVFLPLDFRCSAAADEHGDVTDVVVVRKVEQHPGAALIWEPYIAQWNAKQLVVAYGVGIPGKTDMGDIFATVSTDAGKTWSDSTPIFDHRERHGTLQFAYANFVLYHPPGQDVVWCFAMRCPLSRSHSEDSQLAAAVSADGGRSWVPVELAMHYGGPLIIVGGIYRVMENGEMRYLLPAHRNTLRSDPLGTREQFLLESTSLLEWRLAGTRPGDRRASAGSAAPPGFVPQPAAGKVFLHEGQLAPGDAEGEIKMVMRTSRWDKEGPRPRTADGVLHFEPRRRPHVESRRAGARALQLGLEGVFWTQRARRALLRFERRTRAITHGAALQNQTGGRRMV